MILILIRHGKTEANEKHLYCGSTDVGLSESGIAALTGKKHAGFKSDINNFRIITSGMKRCEQTLSVLFGDIPHETDPAFREMDFGKFEMRSYEELKNDPAYIEWISGDNTSNLTPGGESGTIMQSRVIDGLNRLMNSGKDSLLITHGGVIAAIMDHLFPEENKNIYQWQPSQGEGYVINTDAHRYRKLTF